ncbi:MAG: STAS domain-containing protein [Alphaproteobacteria bacterium]|nr:STAS domain-containing protein [Alphaproteobacteria bacterium]MBV8548491.1 STAS domain-containing protein [Alphaproteobacteria bacterium]
MPVIYTDQWKLSEPGIMELTGRLDSDAGVELEESVILCIQSGMRDLVLDCADLDTVTGAGTQSLLRIAREMQQAGGKLAVCNLNGDVRAMFELCSLDKFIPSYEDQMAARIAMAA